MICAARALGLRELVKLGRLGYGYRATYDAWQCEKREELGTSTMYVWLGDGGPFNHDIWRRTAPADVNFMGWPSLFGIIGYCPTYNCCMLVCDITTNTMGALSSQGTICVLSGMPPYGGTRQLARQPANSPDQNIHSRNSLLLTTVDLNRRQRGGPGGQHHDRDNKNAGAGGGGGGRGGHGKQAHLLPSVIFGPSFCAQSVNFCCRARRSVQLLTRGVHILYCTIHICPLILHPIQYTLLCSAYTRPNFFPFSPFPLRTPAAPTASDDRALHAFKKRMRR